MILKFAKISTFKLQNEPKLLNIVSTNNSHTKVHRAECMVWAWNCHIIYIPGLCPDVTLRGEAENGGDGILREVDLVEPGYEAVGRVLLAEWRRQHIQSSLHSIQMKNLQAYHSYNNIYRWIIISPVEHNYGRGTVSISQKSIKWRCCSLVVLCHLGVAQPTILCLWAKNKGGIKAGANKPHTSEASSWILCVLTHVTHTW